MSQPTEFDIVRVTPNVDLVLFDNVISCYSWNKDITVTYTLGEAVKPTSWDWVGIFRCDWRYLGEYLAYRWTPARSSDCTAPGRRGIVFPSNVHQIPADDRQLYQFLYISHGNHVVGVSSSFRVDLDEEILDLGTTILFREPNHYTELSRRKRKYENVKRKHANPACDTYTVVNELEAGPSVPKRHSPCGKQKMTKVYKDADSLVKFTTQGWSNSLVVVDVRPTVQEYSNSLLSNMQLEKLKIYDNSLSTLVNSSTSRQFDITDMVDPHLPAIQYPTKLSLKAGPQSFLQSLTNGKQICSSCNVAKALVYDLIEKDTIMEGKVNSMIEYVKNLMNERITEEDSCHSTSDLLNWCLELVQRDNQSLNIRIHELEESLAAERAMKNSSSTSSESTETPDSGMEDYGSWIVREPRRIARLKKVVGRQSRTIYFMKQSLENKNVQMTHLKNEIDQLRDILMTARKAGDKFRNLSEYLNTQIKTVLSARSKERTNEWRQFVRTVQESTTQTSSASSSESIENTKTQTEQKASSSCRPKVTPGNNLKHKQIAKLLKSERQPKSKLHKERSQAEQCPTCGLKFSKKTDRRVIEEHMVFHDRIHKTTV